MVVRRIEGRPLPYDQVRDKISAYLRSHVYQRAVSQYLHLLMGEATIEGLAVAGADSPLLQ
jgi:peptidyl-prolyl cis-trans isomerase C